MTPSKKTLFLHAGMGKTGTTAIQESFWANRAALSRAGIAYPAIGAVSGAHHLVTPRIPPFLQDRRGWTFLAPADWAAAVAALPEPRIFMSSELICAAEPAQIAAFCAALTPVFDLRLCLYLRRQDDMIAATYAQGVKAGTQLRPLGAILDRRIDRLDYAARIAPWETALGRDRLIIRPYERSQFHQGDLIRDVLLHVLGLPDLPPGFVHDASATPNARLSIPATEFKRLVNLLMADAARANRFNAPLATCPPDPKGAHLLGRADRDRIITRFAASNATVARDYMGRPAGDLFHDALPLDAPDTAPVPDTAALRQVAVQLGRTAPTLLREIATLAATQDAARPPAAAAAARRLGAALDGLDLPSPDRVRGLGQRLRAAVARLRSRPVPAAVQTPRPAPTPFPRPDPASPPRLIVHFGMHKTGSTSIQQTLWDNRDRLGPALYVDFGRANGSYAMTDFFRRSGDKGRDVAEFDTILAGLGGRTGIISAESISVFSASQIDRMVAAFDRAHAEVHYVGYVRDPVGSYSSHFQQTLKTHGLRFDDPGTWHAGARGPQAYFRWVDMLADRVGADRVQAYPFRREIFPGGDVVAHFLARLADLTGLDPAGITIAQKNESLSALAVKALYAWRRQLAPRDDAAPHPTPAGTFIQRLRDIPGGRFRLAPEVETRIAGLHPDFAGWAADRLIWPAGHALSPVPLLTAPAAGSPVFGREADLLDFTPAEIDTLARWARHPVSGNGTESPADTVARLMAAARDQPPPGRSLQRRVEQRLQTLPGAISGALAKPERTKPDRTATPAAARSGQAMLVHFGTHKTGSSSIQETLFRNEGRLGGQHYLSFGTANSSLVIRRTFLGRDESSALQREAARLRLQTEMRRHAAATRTILSAEVISFLDAAETASLIETLQARGATLTFIGYLRDPVTYSRSAFQEQIKGGLGKGLPFQPDSQPRHRYHQIVDQLDALVGRDRVQVFPFDRALFPQGDVVRHFLDQAGIESEGLTIHRVNESLPMTAVKALYAYRRLRVARDSSIGSNTTRDSFIAALAGLGGPPFLLSPAVEARIARRNTHILDWSETRLGQRLAVPLRADEDGIRDEADMLAFSEEERDRLDALARSAGVAGLPARQAGDDTAAAVADLLHRLRLKAAGKT